MVRENNFTACAKTLFEILFNIVKKLPNKRLLPPTLRYKMLVIDGGTCVVSTYIP